MNISRKSVALIGVVLVVVLLLAALSANAIFAQGPGMWDGTDVLAGDTGPE